MYAADATSPHRIISRPCRIAATRDNPGERPVQERASGRYCSSLSFSRSAFSATIRWSMTSCISPSMKDDRL